MGIQVSIYVCVCVCARAREMERQRVLERQSHRVGGVGGGGEKSEL